VQWSRSTSLSWGTASSWSGQLFYLLLVLGALEQVHISQLGYSLQSGQLFYLLLLLSVLEHVHISQLRNSLQSGPAVLPSAGPGCTGGGLHLSAGEQSAVWPTVLRFLLVLSALEQVHISQLGNSLQSGQLFYLLLVPGTLEQVYISQLGNSLQSGPAECLLAQLTLRQPLTQRLLAVYQCFSQ
jgi:hypothetical protein